MPREPQKAHATVAVASSIGAFLSASPAMADSSASGPPPQSASTAILAPDSLPATLVSIVQDANNMVTSTWDGSGFTNTMTEPAGSVIDFQPVGEPDSLTGVDTPADPAITATVTPNIDNSVLDDALNGSLPGLSEPIITELEAEADADLASVDAGVAEAEVEVDNIKYSSSIKDGTIFASGEDSFCGHTTCMHVAEEQSMAQNIPAETYVGQILTTTITNNGSKNAEGGASYTNWPGEKGDETTKYGPSGSYQGSTQAAFGVTFGAFSFTDTVNVPSGALYTFDFPNGDNQPAFGAAWANSSSGAGNGAADDSSNVVHVAEGQNCVCDYTLEVL